MLNLAVCVDHGEVFCSALSADLQQGFVCGDSVENVFLGGSSELVSVDYPTEIPKPGTNIYIKLSVLGLQGRDDLNPKFVLLAHDNKFP